MKEFTRLASDVPPVAEVHLMWPRIHLISQLLHTLLHLLAQEVPECCVHYKMKWDNLESKPFMPKITVHRPNLTNNVMCHTGTTSPLHRGHLGTSPQRTPWYLSTEDTLVPLHRGHLGTSLQRTP